MPRLAPFPLTDAPLTPPNKPPALDDRGLPPGYPFKPEYEITPREARGFLRELPTDTILLDVRTAPEWHTAHVPGGAFPSYAFGYYPRDNAFYLAWDAISRDRDTFRAWIDEHVLRSSPESFAEHAARVA